MPTITRQQAEALIAEKAQNDPAFRRELIEQPKAVLSREFGLDLPPSVKVAVVEESAQSFYLVLPPPRPAAGELADEDLEAVAGGTLTTTADKSATDPCVVSSLPSTEQTKTQVGY
jgi:hypothetical protein